jgi:hypothetical protein
VRSIFTCPYQLEANAGSHGVAYDRAGRSAAGAWRRKMNPSRSKLALVTAILLAAPAIASAAGWRTAESPGLMTPMGEYFMVGGGVSDFTDSARQDQFDMGATWEARLGIGSRSFIGAEAAYVGALRGAVVGDNDLMAHGAEGVLRVQYPYVQGSWLVEPFAMGGSAGAVSRSTTCPRARRTPTTSASSRSARA